MKKNKKEFREIEHTLFRCNCGSCILEIVFFRTEDCKNPDPWTLYFIRWQRGTTRLLKRITDAYKVLTNKDYLNDVVLTKKQVKKLRDKLTKHLEVK